MSSLLTLCREITERTGLITRYLGGILVLITFLVVLLRYGFNYAPIALQETMTYLHAALFMLGAAYTLKHNGHVRVDVFYQNMSVRKQAWVNIFGTLFLLFPTCLFVLIICWPYVADSWSIQERSIEGSGLPFLYLLKTLLILQPLLLMIQGVAIIIENGVKLTQTKPVQNEGGQ
ncbi:TRAP transporter small permease subunit [Bermanella marisrubri]|uniref:TRAP transporter small permease protein n=1 Tax=Bermanella marisrubri TaxID=207949 RepID=Q1N3Y0_9GAMM|nr:TRAP transporter small permease subunit [Bermanella marisrubri]EAT13085.1 TRAP-type mannitol/chloroaromatic compound transport system, small permease component [Oceanobacter sp. RED65] [Bermanella marisrubri]QIZ82799.1 TRAP transporter small permease subunit [Bermanella marisrubri]